MLNNPEVLYLDEPTVGVDTQSRNYILEMIKKLNSEYNTTIIYTSHYMDEIQQISDYVTIIDHGKIVLNQSKEDLLEQENVFIISLETIHDNVHPLFSNIDGVKLAGNDVLIHKDIKSTSLIHKITSICAENNLRIKSLESNRNSIEEIYLKLTDTELRD